VYVLNPKISIIVPIYNAERFLYKCLDSIINQKYKNIEIILVNDGSSDKSGEICNKYADVDNRIQVLHIENQGVSNARNKGIELASGGYIGFVDSDDWIDEEMYSDMLNKLTTYNADIIMCGHVIYDGENERYVGFPWKQDSVIEFEDIHKTVIPSFLAPMDIYGNKQQIVMGSVCKCLFKRDLIKQNQILFDTQIKYTEDTVFIIQSFIKAKKVLFINTPYYHYRKERERKISTTQKYIENMYSSLKLSQRHIYKTLDESGCLNLALKHIHWRNCINVFASISNLCSKGSPYSLRERKKKARYYIDDSSFKQSIEEVRLSYFTPKQKVLALLVKYSLISIIIWYYKLKK
jgi:glycosyltransferase involved in cell wall biosynthesis